MSTREESNGSAEAVRGEWVLEGEIAVKVDLGLFHLPAALDAGLFVGAAGADIAEDALAIELLFQTAEGLVDRFAAFEPDFNHGGQLYRKGWRRGRAYFGLSLSLGLSEHDPTKVVIPATTQ